MSTPKQKPGQSFQAYKTPNNFIMAVRELLDITNFSWDLAADDSNTQSPDGWYTEQDSAFNHDWAQIGGWLWLNPPFSNIEPWALKANQSAQLGAKIAMLVPASVGANWYKKYVHNQSYVLYLNGRLAFIPEQPTWLYPKDCMLILWTKWAIGNNVWDWRK